MAGAEALKREAVAAYEQTVQNAFKDMRDALTGQEQYALAVKWQERQVDVLSQAVVHARYRFNNGYSSYLDLLDAERSLFSAELEFHRYPGPAIIQHCGRLSGDGGRLGVKSTGFWGLARCRIFLFAQGTRFPFPC